MRTGFFGAKKDKLFLVLDIGTEAVKALILKKDIAKMAVFGGSARYFEKYGVFDSRDFQTDLIKKTISKTIEETYQALTTFPEEIELKKQNGLPVLVALPPNVFKARVICQSCKREKPNEKISKEEEKIVCQQAFKDAKNEISQEFVEEFGILPAELQWIDFKVLGIKIDGYPVLKSQGYEGKNLEFKILATFLPKHYLEALKRTFEDLELKIHKLVHIGENLPTLLKDKKGNATFLDVGGEITQLFLVRKGELEEIRDFGTGGKAFSQELAERLGISEDSARILKERYSNKLLTAETEKRVKEILLTEKAKWYQDLKSELKKIDLPVFLLGGGSLLPEIPEVLKENGIPSKFIFPKDIEDIKDLTKKIKSPQYVSSLLISYYANAKEIL